MVLAGTIITIYSVEFVKTWVNNEEGLRRQEGGDEGGGRKDKQNLGPQLLTYQVVMKGVAPGAATKDATQPNHLVVPVSGGPGIDPSFDDVHSRPRREFFFANALPPWLTDAS